MMHAKSALRNICTLGLLAVCCFATVPVDAQQAAPAANPAANTAPIHPHAIADYMQAHGKLFGLSLDILAASRPYQQIHGSFPRLQRPDDYLERVAPYSSLFTVPINFTNLHYRGKEQFDFSRVDALVAFAASHHAKVKGHSLLFPGAMPPWVEKGNYTPDQMQEILKTHIQTVVAHLKQLKEQYRKTYPDFTIDYQVTNELTCNTKALTNDPKSCTQAGEQLADGKTIDPRIVGLQKNIWSVIHKPGSVDPTDYIQLAFEWAHAADPEAKLYMAENVALGPKLNTVYFVASYLVEKHVPIYGIGVEGHISLHWEDEVIFTADKQRAQINSLEHLISGAVVGNNRFVGLDSFAQLGLQTQITEFDVAMSSKNGQRNYVPVLPEQGEVYQQALQQQAKLYQTFFLACMRSKTCNLFNIFGAWDPVDWTALHPDDIPNGGVYRPYFIDDNWQLKPAFWAMYNAAK